MFQVRVVVVLLALLAPVIETLPICTPVAAAGVMNVGTPAPPLAELLRAPPALPEPAAAAVTWLAAMLLPPLVRAAAPLATQAQIVTWVRPGCRTHAVCTDDVVLPGLAAVLAASVKLTVAPLVTLTVSDSGKVALSVTVGALEFS